MKRALTYIGFVIGFGVLALLAVVSYIYFVATTPPVDFAQNQFIEISKGSSLNTIAELLEQQKIISSAELFKIGVYVTGRQEDLKSGTYYFTEPVRMEEIIRNVLNGSFNVPTERVTILEGQAAYQFVESIAEVLPKVDTQSLLDEIMKTEKEGFLYPDTYFFPQDSTVEDVIKIMEKNFSKKIEPFEQSIAASGYTLNEVLTMASLVENEAGSASYETKQRVAGVLWKRVEINMPIQADAVFGYIYQQHLPRVLLRHLEVDSPYNIYKNTGLPPGPIGNPSIDSIRATLDPIITEDLFYLTGFDGNFYYSKTNGGHERNRRLHLNYKQ